MFTNLVSNIREKLVKKEQQQHQQQQNQQQQQQQQSDILASTSTRFSVDEQASGSPGRRASDGQLYSSSTSSSAIAQAIPVQKRRRATLYGISNVSADDYMQKDLISSSWS